ncbi:hypothetical protein ACU686_36650 [Yinghuangia aomiensis]
MAELHAMLDHGRYHVAVPEEAALLTIAWLLRAGNRAEALALLDEIALYADRLRFLPRPSDTRCPTGPPCTARPWATCAPRSSARPPKPSGGGDERGALRCGTRTPTSSLAHWLETVDDDGPGAIRPAGWAERGRELLQRYDRLAAQRQAVLEAPQPEGESSAILRKALADTLGVTPGAPARTLSGVPPSPPHASPSRTACSGMPCRRWSRSAARPVRPSTPRCGPARPRTRRRRPLHELARVLISRLANLRDDAGLPDTSMAAGAGRRRGSRSDGHPRGQPDPGQPAASGRACAGARRWPNWSSAASCRPRRYSAELVPQLVAATTALAYHDPALRTLTTAVYEGRSPSAGRCCCSTWSTRCVEELKPWVEGRVSKYRRVSSDTAGNARAALTELGTLTVRVVPGTIDAEPAAAGAGFAGAAGRCGAVFTEELAADIFMGTFSAKFLRAAQAAGELLEGTLYERLLRHRLCGDPGDRRRQARAGPGRGHLGRVRGAVPGPGRHRSARGAGGWLRTGR